MVADHIAYRVEKYEAMKFSYAEACTLAHTLDDNGLPLYWSDVKSLLTRCGGNHALTLDILVALPEQNIVYGGEDDGA